MNVRTIRRAGRRLGIATLVAGAFAATAPVTASAQSCDVARGERVFASCAICHARQPDAPSPAGPNLHGVVGRKAATVPGFRYSRALRESGKIWSVVELDRFLAAPQTAVPGTAMAFAGLRNADDRAAVVCLLAGAGAPAASSVAAATARPSAPAGTASPKVSHSKANPGGGP